MRVVFAGTPEFAATALAALLDGGFDIPLVLTQPDRPAGRGQKLVASPVAQLARARGLAVATPATLNLKKGGALTQTAHGQIEAACADVLVVAAYGLILPPAVLAAPRGLPVATGARVTALNIHASLLPRWRGAAPIARAIEAGDSETGITIMEMEAGLDTGPMLLAQSTAIDESDTTATLSQRLSSIGAQLITEVLRNCARLTPQRQPEQGVTYANKIEKREAWLDFTRPADLLARRVRAFDPFPVASAVAHSVPLKIWRAHCAESPLTPEQSSVQSSALSTVPPAAQSVAQPIPEASTRSATTESVLPGTVRTANADGVRIACGHGDLIVSELQRPGGRRLRAREFLSGFSLAAGDRLTRLPEDARPAGIDPT